MKRLSAVVEPPVRCAVINTSPLTHGRYMRRGAAIHPHSRRGTLSLPSLLPSWGRQLQRNISIPMGKGQRGMASSLLEAVRVTRFLGWDDTGACVLVREWESASSNTSFHTGEARVLWRMTTHCDDFQAGHGNLLGDPSWRLIGKVALAGSN